MWRRGEEGKRGREEERKRGREEERKRGREEERKRGRDREDVPSHRCICYTLRDKDNSYSETGEYVPKQIFLKVVVGNPGGDGHHALNIGVDIERVRWFI